MASVLSLRPQSPFKRSFSDNPYLRSCSPLRDNTLGALRDITPRNVSACSLFTVGAIGPGEWLRSGENTPPLASRSLLDLSHQGTRPGSLARHTDDAPRKRSYGLNRPPPSFSGVEAPLEPSSKKRKAIKLPTPLSITYKEPVGQMDVDGDERDNTDLFDLYDAIHVPLPEGRGSDNTNNEPYGQAEELPEVIEAVTPGFRRWMSTLRKRHVHRRKDTATELPGMSIDAVDLDASIVRSLVQVTESIRRRSTSMSSSIGYVTAMKTASVTVASASIAPRSEGASLQARVRLGKRSSNFSDVRKSTDSNAAALGPVLDESAWLRSMQRRKIVEEIISSEEGYIGDLKVLINVSFSILGGSVQIGVDFRSRITS